MSHRRVSATLLGWAFDVVDTWPAGLAVAAIACLGIVVTETVALWRAYKRREQDASS